MPTKHVGAVYLVDIACFSIAAQKKYRDNLPSNKKKVETLEVKVSGPLPGTRSYECKVVGTGDSQALQQEPESRACLWIAHENARTAPKFF
jgi:hypothetical protein